MASFQKTFALIAITWATTTAVFTFVYRDRLVLLCAGMGSVTCLRASLTVPSELNYHSADSGGTTPLLYYLDHTRTMHPSRAAEGLKLLLSSGADPSYPDQDGWTPLMVASANGQAQLIRILLDNGVDVNHRAESKTQLDGMTALMAAAHHGHIAVVQLLLSEGARPEIRSPSGLNAITIAALEGHHAIVRILEKRGTSVNADIARELAQEGTSKREQEEDEEEPGGSTEAALDKENALGNSLSYHPKRTTPDKPYRPLRKRLPEE